MNVPLSHRPPAPALCPICFKAVSADAPTYPFCSPRCKTIDLARWVKGDYVISRPIEEKDLEDGE